jgi:hypothetical protein
MKAYEYLKNRGWCQGVGALDASGKVTGLASPTAVCFCIDSAVFNSYADVLTTNFKKYNWAMMKVAKHLGFSDAPAVVKWNDTEGRTKEEVLAALQSAGV